MREIRRLGLLAARAACGCVAGAADLVLPSSCAACGSPEIAADGLCAECGVALLALAALPYCHRCGSTLGPNVPQRDDGCPGCPSVLPRFASVVRVGPYAPPLRGVVQQLKYHRREGMLRRLGEMLSAAVAARLADGSADVVVPVPMHWRRRLERGYDHSAAIASRLAGRLDLPLGNELVRVRYTPPQVRLPRTRRIQSVRGAFEAADDKGLAGTHVLLVDDVTTTGATANEAARSIIAAGANRVTLAVIAKAEPPSAYSGHWG
jgi:ComF family protein